MTSRSWNDVHSVLSCYDGDEIVQELTSGLYPGACGNLGSVISLFA